MNESSCNSCVQDGKAVKEPKFNKLAYADSGVYVCEVSVAGLVRRQSFELMVEGQSCQTSPREDTGDPARPQGQGFGFYSDAEALTVRPGLCRKGRDHQPDQTPRRRSEIQSPDLPGGRSARTQLPLERQRHQRESQGRDAPLTRRGVRCPWVYRVIWTGNADARARPRTGDLSFRDAQKHQSLYFRKSIIQRHQYSHWS